MSRLSVPLAAVAVLLLPGIAEAQEQGYRAGRDGEPNRDELIEQATAAAPEEIGQAAAVVVPQEDGTMEEIRAGTNGFTCIPDDPRTPGSDPMCLDPNALEWAKALMAQESEPPDVPPGIGYMLQGASDISATDPFAEPTPDQEFIDSPPHFMIFYPFDADTTGFSTEPKDDGAWIMWAGTPYAHLMVNTEP